MQDRHINCEGQLDLFLTSHKLQEQVQLPQLNPFTSGRPGWLRTFRDNSGHQKEKS